jgi:hypothetical protein
MGRVPQLPYDLAQVRHIDGFTGSQRAKNLLAHQGFVVTEEQFRQIFEPYLPSSHVKMPTFITVDSAWHTYHVLLEEGVQDVELGQARLLQRFSRRLHQIASGHKAASVPVYHDLATFAAVAWAIQDSTCLGHLPSDERATVTQALRAIESGGKALFFELPLQPENLRPAGFYTKTPELAHYFTARRWYATSAFRLKSEVETLRALYLSWLVESDPELRRLHSQLTTPPERMVGPTDDPGVVQYAELASRLAKGSFTEEKIPQIVNDFRREASKFPGPQINDQFLLPNQFAVREEETKGMRLFGDCQLPSAILFQKTIEPAITTRALPSGVDVFAAGPLACEAGRRALRSMEPAIAVYEAVCRAECGSLPDSLHGKAMDLLRLIQEPLPKTAPAALRTSAWQDKQLWMGLGAWAEERHTWVLHAKPLGAPGCAFEEPPGYVSPYPKFYQQLGQLARRAAAVLPNVAADPDYQAAGLAWLKARQKHSQGPAAHLRAMSEEVVQEEIANNDMAERMAAAMREYFQQVGKDIGAANIVDRAEAWGALDALALRCAENKCVTENDRRCMRAFLQAPEGNAVQLLPEFADLCDQLATIAEKELAGNALNAKELALIRNYGETLARFHFYVGYTSRSPRDDFPCISPVCNNALRGKTLYAGVGRPEAIYVVLFTGKRLVLHRGAVLTYREFPRPLGQGPDDDKWRDEVRMARASSPPTWTASFRSVVGEQERKVIVRKAAGQLREGKLHLEDCPVTGHEITEAIIERLLRKWHPSSRPDSAERAKENEAEDAMDGYDMFQTVLQQAQDEDVPALVDKLLPATPEMSISEVVQCLDRLNWKPYREKLAALARHSRPLIAWKVAALLRDPAMLPDLPALAKAFTQQPPDLRAEYCYLIGQSRQVGFDERRILVAGLHDSSWQVRYHAAAAIARCHAKSREIVAGLQDGLLDRDTTAAAAMVHAAVALNVTDGAPRMLVWLKEHSLIKTDYHISGLRLHDEEIKSLSTEIITALGEFRYAPAKDALRGLVFEPRTEYEFCSAAFKALLKIEDKRQFLAAVFQDHNTSESLLQLAIVEVWETNDIKYVKTMLPLFEDVGRSATQGHSSEAVWAAWHINGILEHACQQAPEGVKVYRKIHDALLRQAHGPAARDALEALKYFDPAAAARECLSVAIDKDMDKDARTNAIAILREAPKPWPIRELLPILNEAPEDADSVLSVGYYAAWTVGALSKKLDRRNPQEAQTLRLVEKTFADLLKGPRGVVAVRGLTEMSDVPHEVLLGVALDRTLPYTVRTHVIMEISDYRDFENAKRLIPLLVENTQPGDEKPTIALCAANTIASIVGKEPWNGEEPLAGYLQKARTWAETAESK